MGHLSAKCPPLYLAVGGQLLYTSGRKLIDNQKCFPKFTKCQFNAKIINLARRIIVRANTLRSKRTPPFIVGHW